MRCNYQGSTSYYIQQTLICVRTKTCSSSKKILLKFLTDLADLRGRFGFNFFPRLAFRSPFWYAMVPWMDAWEFQKKIRFQKKKKKVKYFSAIFFCKGFLDNDFSHWSKVLFPAENRWNSQTDFLELWEHVWKKNKWRFEWKQLLKVSECFYKSIFYCEQ